MSREAVKQGIQFYKFYHAKVLTFITRFKKEFLGDGKQNEGMHMDKESKYYVSNDKHRRNLNKLVEIYETKHRQNPWVCHRYGIHFCISDLVELYLHLTRKFLPAALYNNLSDAEKARFDKLLSNQNYEVMLPKKFLRILLFNKVTKNFWVS